MSATRSRSAPTRFASRKCSPPFGRRSCRACHASTRRRTPPCWQISSRRPEPDAGEIDADGFIRVTDRKKDILVTAGGKNVAPQNLENALKTAPLVSQALVVGDRRPYVAALITVDPEQVEGVPAEELEARVQAIVDGVNAALSRFEQIKRFAILPREFSAEEGEVTPTLKLKRRVCEEHFAAEIKALYSR